MATVPGDLIRLRWTSGETMDVDLSRNPGCGISWPPPPRLLFWGAAWFERTSMSELSDEQALAGASHHVARGAVYEQRAPDDFGAEATCIGCGCTDSHGCPEGCYWLAVDRAAGRGVCSSCRGHMPPLFPPEQR